MMYKKRVIAFIAAACLVFVINGVAEPYENNDITLPQPEVEGAPPAIEEILTLVLDEESGFCGKDVILRANIVEDGLEEDIEIVYYLIPGIEIYRELFSPGSLHSVNFLPTEPIKHIFYAELLARDEAIAQSKYVIYNVQKLENELTLSVDKATVNAGEPVTLTAQLQHPAEDVITFKEGENILESVDMDENGKALLSLSDLTPGLYSFTAVYGGNGLYNESVSNIVTSGVLSADSKLTDIRLTDGQIYFNKDIEFYSADVKNASSYIRVTPVTSHEGATVLVTARKFSQTLSSGEQSDKIYLDEGVKTDVKFIVTAQNGGQRLYTIRVCREKSITTYSRGATIKYRFDRTGGVNEIAFADTAFHWAEGVIYALAQKGVLTGEINSGRHYFYPERDITRTEFAVMLSKAMSLDVAHTRYLPLPFDDEKLIPEWGAEHIRAVYFNGWMEGDGAGFNPHSVVTRAEAMVALARAGGGVYGGDIQFNDSELIPDWAASAISGLTEKGVVSGYGDGTIRPLNSVNRAEAAKMLYGLIY